MFVQTYIRKSSTPPKLAKAEGDNPLVDAVAKRPIAQRVRTSTTVLSAREREIYESVRQAVAALTQNADTAFVRRLVAEGVDQVLNGISLGSFISELQPMVDALSSEVVARGAAHVKDLPLQMGAKMRFDYLDPRAVQWAQQRAGELITTVVDDQRATIRNVIAQGVQDQITVNEMAKNVRDVVGLPESWAQAVPKARMREYAKLIKDGVAPNTASSKADAVAEKYKQRLVNARAKTIARTEIMTASNQGRWLSWAQTTEQGFIPKNAKKEWISAPGFGPKPKLCEVCADLNGVTTSWDKPFPGTDVMMPPQHPNCRCTAVIVPFDMADLEFAVSIPDSTYDLAQRFVDEASDIEGAITDRVRQNAEAMGGRLEGLDNRLKARNSYARKIHTDAAEKGISLEEAGKNIKDGIRYTTVLPPERYSQGVRNYLLDLQAQGTEFKSKVRWTKPDTYHGVNVFVKDRATGKWYEMQFHTEGSLKTKNKVHAIYEKERRLPIGDPQKPILNKKMQDLAGSQVFPKDIDLLLNLDMPVPVARRARTSIDEWFVDRKEVENEKKRLLQVLNKETMSKDMTLHSVAEIQGYNGLPIRVATKAEGDDLVAQGWTKVYRGVREEAQAEQFIGGEIFHGTGISGNGTYATSRAESARMYASFRNDEGYVIEMFLPPDAKVITSDEMTKLTKSVADKLNGELGNSTEFFEIMDVISDPGRLASMLGYDAIQVVMPASQVEVTGQYFVVLNRSKVAARVIRDAERDALIALGF